MAFLLKIVLLMIVAGVFGVLLGAQALFFFARSFIELDFLAKILMGSLSMSCWLIYMKLFQMSEIRLGFKLEPVYLAILLLPTFFAIYVAANVFEQIAIQLFNMPTEGKYFRMVQVLAYMGGLIGAAMFLGPIWQIILWQLKSNQRNLK